MPDSSAVLVELLWVAVFNILGTLFLYPPPTFKKLGIILYRFCSRILDQFDLWNGLERKWRHTKLRDFSFGDV